MTKDNKNLNPIGQFKSQLNTPKTETRIILNDWQNDWQGEVKTSKLSPAAKKKIVNNGSYISFRVGITNPSYGPMPDDHGCPQKASFEVSMYCTGDYVVTNGDGTLFMMPDIASGDIIDKNFSGIQKRIDDLKSGKVKVYKGKDTSHNAKREHTEECAKYEGWFQAQLENALENLKTANVYGSSISYTFIKP